MKRKPTYHELEQEVGLLRKKCKSFENEERYRQMFQFSPDSIIIHDLDMSIIDVNNAAIKEFGYQKEELLKKTIFELHTNEELQHSSRVLKTVNEKGISKVETKFIKKDGSFFWAEATPCKYILKGKPIIHVVIRNITKRKKVEEKLKESEEKFRKAFATNPDAITISRIEDGVFVEANKGFMDIMGYQPNEVIGKNSLELNIWANPDDRSRLIRGLNKKGIIKNFESLFCTKTGDFKNGLSSANIIYLNAKPHLLNISHDITERKRAEKVQKILYNITNAVLTTNNLGELIGIISEEMGTIIDTSNFFVALYDEKTDTFSLPYYRDSFDKFITFPAAKTITRYVVETEKSLLANLDKLTELEKAGKIELHGTDSLIWLGIPLKVSEKVTGAMVTQSYTDKNAFNESDKELLEIISSQISLAIHRKKTEQELQILNEELASQNKEYVVLNKELNESVEHIKQINAELNKAKEKVEESEKKYKALYENAPLSYQSLDNNGNFIDINPTWIKTLGYTREEIIGNWFGDFLHPDFVEHFRKNFSNFKKNGFIHNVQFKIKHKQGNYLFIAFEGIVGYNPNGSIKQTFCTFKDITTEFYVKEELIKAKEHAEESDRLKSAFLANMSHEIRTPMNGILGFSKLLKERGLTGKQQQKYIDIIEKGGARMLNIINDIVNISKIESGQMEVNIQLSNINEQIEYIYTFFKPDIEGKGMQFSFLNSLPSKEAIIKTDREKVYAILTNLVKNAIKYSEKGSIELGYNLKKDSELPELEFYIKDTGIGIPTGRQEAIFERFIQADIEDKLARQGAGLGLSISKAYVEMLGGKIWVESEEENLTAGKKGGSTFYFTLPYQPQIKIENIDRHEISHPIELSSINNLKVLIVEDDEASEEFISIIVQKFANKILKVRTGAEAVEACHNNTDIDLVLMDIQLPEMNGYEATRKIREFNKDMIIIAQTAFAIKGDSEKAIAVGCNDYITKPIKIEELEKLIVKNM